MAVSTSRVIRLTFNTSGGATFAVTIPSPQETLTPADALNAVETVINSGIFIASSGELTSIRDIKIIDTTTEDLYDPPQA